MGNTSRDNNRLTSSEIRRFKGLLLAKRLSILGDVFAMENETLHRPRSDLSSMPIHMADIGTDNYEMENTIGLMDSERKLLVEIDEALARIENGTYGVCEGEEEPIPKERLKAIPWARYCIACASLSDKGLLGREDYLEQLDNENESSNDQDHENPDEPVGE